MSRSPSIQFPNHTGEKKTCYYVSQAGKRENSCAFCFLRIWIEEEEAESDCGQKTNSFFFLSRVRCEFNCCSRSLSLSLSLLDFNCFFEMSPFNSYFSLSPFTPSPFSSVFPLLSFFRLTLLSL